MTEIDERVALLEQMLLALTPGGSEYVDPDGSINAQRCFEFAQSRGRAAVAATKRRKEAEARIEELEADNATLDAALSAAIKDRDWHSEQLDRRDERIAEELEEDVETVKRTHWRLIRLLSNEVDAGEERVTELEANRETLLETVDQYQCSLHAAMSERDTLEAQLARAHHAVRWLFGFWHGNTLIPRKWGGELQERIQEAFERALEATDVKGESHSPDTE